MRPSPETLADLAERHSKGAHVWCWVAFDHFPELLAYIRDLEAVAEAARATRYWGGVGSMLDAALAALDIPGETG